MIIVEEGVALSTQERIRNMSVVTNLMDLVRLR